MCKSLCSLVFAPGSALERVGKSAFADTLLGPDDVRVPAGADASEAFAPRVRE